VLRLHSGNTALVAWHRDALLNVGDRLCSVGSIGHISKALQNSHQAAAAGIIRTSQVLSGGSLALRSASRIERPHVTSGGYRPFGFGAAGGGGCRGSFKWFAPAGHASRNCMWLEAPTIHPATLTMRAGRRTTCAQINTMSWQVASRELHEAGPEAGQSLDTHHQLSLQSMRRW
jgi:hypothetical protein